MDLDPYEQDGAPRANVLDYVAAMFGGGPDLRGAYGQGQLVGARTAEAMERARRERDINLARSELRGVDLLNITPEISSSIVLGGVGTDYAGMERGAGLGQERQFRERLSNPDLLPAESFALGRALSSTPQSPIQSVGAHGAVNLMDENPEVQLTPSGQAYVQAQEALAERRLRAPAAPLERVVGPTGDPVLVPRPDAAGMEPAPTGRPPRTAEQELEMQMLREIAKQFPNISAAEAFQKLREVQAAAQGDASAGGDVPAGIPAGSTMGGYTANGEQVWIGPDGKRYAWSPD